MANRRELVLSIADPLRLRTRVAGLFLFLPLLTRLGFDEIVREAGYAGSQMVPADAALLGLLTLKLLDKERRTHIDDFNFEEALGLFAGLKSAVIDIPKRRQKRNRYLEESVRLADSEGAARQIAVTGLGREEPTLLLTNHLEAGPRDLIMNYARGKRIEDRLGTSVKFFHLDCLSSEVHLNVDLDVTRTVIANGCYGWLGRQLKGLDKAKPKQLQRTFVETRGLIDVASNQRLVVTFDRRSHNPIVREAALDRDGPATPWLKGYRVEYNYN